MSIKKNHKFIDDRVSGVLIGAACGDALGAGYEFGPALPVDTDIYMRGQGAFAPGEWTDDSAQMIAIAMAAVTSDIATTEGQDAIAKNFLEWYFSPAREKDIGIHTSQVMRQVTDSEADNLAERFNRVASAKEEGNPGTSGGNGALMRTAAIALAKLANEQELVDTAISTAMLTHADAKGAQSAAVWCLAIKVAIETDSFTSQADLEVLKDNIIEAIERTMPNESVFWKEQLDSATGRDPREFTSGNGYSVQTLKCAWAAITHTPIQQSQPAQHFANALKEAVRAGNDADTVACVAGSLLAAIWGLSAIPTRWRAQIHGWPTMRDRDLHTLALNIVNKPESYQVENQWPNIHHMHYTSWSGTDSIAVHPHDNQVILSGFNAANGTIELPKDVDAVVSLCRMGTEDIRHLKLPPGNHVEVRIIDIPGDNAHTELTLSDAADTVAHFRSQGKTVLLHCVAAQSRTPTVAALYAIRHKSIDPQTAFNQINQVLTNAQPNLEFTNIVLNHKEQA